jgi:hypothetical protein
MGNEEKAKDEKMKRFSNIICNGLSYNNGPFPLLNFMEGEAGLPDALVVVRRLLE